jgi:hypothetical protein
LREVFVGRGTGDSESLAISVGLFTSAVDKLQRTQHVSSSLGTLEFFDVHANVI